MDLCKSPCIFHIRYVEDIYNNLFVDMIARGLFVRLSSKHITKRGITAIETTEFRDY